MVLISDLSERNQFTGSKSRCEEQNRTATAWAQRFRVYADGQNLHKVQTTENSGYLAQSVLPLYFGLDESTKIDRIEVDWPSGAKKL